jgi:hypothetical protein
VKARFGPPSFDERARFGPPSFDEPARFGPPSFAERLDYVLVFQVFPMIDARCDAALADRSLAESARRSIAQRARWILHDFKLSHGEAKA